MWWGRDAAFVHDSFMQPMFGTARADFPGGTRRSCISRYKKFLALPDATRPVRRLTTVLDYRPQPTWVNLAWLNSADIMRISEACVTRPLCRLLPRRTGHRTLSLPDRCCMSSQLNLQGRALAGRRRKNGHAYLKISAQPGSKGRCKLRARILAVYG